MLQQQCIDTPLHYTCTDMHELELLLWLNIRAIDLMIINKTMNCYVYCIYGSSKTNWIYMKQAISLGFGKGKKNEQQISG